MRSIEALCDSLIVVGFVRSLMVVRRERREFPSSINQRAALIDPLRSWPDMIIYYPTNGSKTPLNACLKNLWVQFIEFLRYAFGRITDGPLAGLSFLCSKCRKRLIIEFLSALELRQLRQSNEALECTLRIEDFCHFLVPSAIRPKLVEWGTDHLFFLGAIWEGE